MNPPAPEGDAPPAPVSPAADHRRAAARRHATAAVVTLSDTRTPATDRGGDLAVDRITAAGHRVVRRELLPDDAARLGELLDRWLDPNGGPPGNGDAAVTEPVDLIVTTGGTGLSRRDVAVDAVRPRLTREIPGFGELFRQLSFAEIGPAAMLSRAVGGLAASSFVFALPGSPAAVALGLDRLILPELPHLLRERDR